MYAGSLMQASRSFTHVVFHQRRLLGIVRVAVDQPDSKLSKKPGKLWSEELFERCEQLEANGFSREAAKTMVTTQFMTEWTIEGPIGNLDQKLKVVDEEVKVQGFRQNVVIGLLVLVLFSLDVTKLENSVIGAALKFLLTL